MQGKILVIVEMQGDRLSKHSLEVIALIQQLKFEQLLVACAGKDLTTTIDELKTLAVDQIHPVEHEQLSTYSSDAYCQAYAILIEHLKPEWIVFPHSYTVRDFAPVLAARFERSLIADCIAIQSDDSGSEFTRPLFQGRCHATVSANTSAPVFVSIQSGSFNADQIQLATQIPPVLPCSVTIEAKSIRWRAEEPASVSGTGSVDLSKAEFIVAVGRGIKSAEHLPMLQRLAELLGAEIAASRPICDEQWLPIERQVGSSGQTVAPKIYMAIGISGAIQHVVGMKSAVKIVAVNSDPEAPIFKVADIGIVADLFEFVPELIKQLEQIKK